MSGPAYIDVFRSIKVMPDNLIISADAVNDTLTLTAGSGISLVANPDSDQLTIVNTGIIDAIKFNIAADDSVLREVRTDETVRFSGTQGVSTTTDLEGNVVISGPPVNTSTVLTIDTNDYVNLGSIDYGISVGSTSGGVSFNFSPPINETTGLSVKNIKFPNGSIQTDAWRGFYVTGDDSTKKLINSDETIKFSGSNGVTVSADSEGNIVIGVPELDLLSRGVPYIVPEDRNFLIIENTQNLFNYPIEINGTLDVEGILIEV